MEHLFGEPLRNEQLIGQIFPRGYNYGQEKIGRNLAQNIGYNNLMDINKGVFEDVDIKKIIPCQTVISTARIIQYMLYLREHDDVPGNPIAIRIGEDVYLLDGHHRVSAQILLGRQTVRILVTELKEDDELVIKEKSRFNI